MTGPAPDTPFLTRAAQRQFAIAQATCSDACRDYHGAWGYLRLVGRPTGVVLDHDAMQAQVADALRAGVRRILIAATADAGILSYVIAGADALGLRPQVTVADRCATPLETCRWYAAQMGWQVDTLCADLLAYDAGQFDMVLAHNLLNSIAPDDRPRLAANWRRMLAPGGRIVVFSALRTGHGDRARRFSGEAEAVLFEAMTAAIRAGGHSADEAGRAVAAARAYLDGRRMWNLQSDDELAAPFLSAGLAVQIADSDPKADIAGPRRRRVLTATRPGAR